MIPAITAETSELALTEPEILMEEPAEEIAEVTADVTAEEIPAEIAEEPLGETSAELLPEEAPSPLLYEAVPEDDPETIAVTEEDLQEEIIPVTEEAPADVELSTEETKELPEDDPMEATFLLLSASPQTDIYYSSDLADFITEIQITDSDDVPITETGTVYIGETYTIHLCFDESNVDGNEKQFRYNDDGYLTYQFDTDHFRISATAANPILEGDRPIGEYFVDENGLLHARFYYLDEDGNVTTEPTDRNIIDSSSTASFFVNADGKVYAGENEERISIDFSQDITISLNINKGGSLETQKTSSGYDKATRSIKYTVTVSCGEGRVDGITLADEADLKIGKLDYGRTGFTFRDIVITGPDGQTVTDEEGHPVTSLEDFNALGASLIAGESYTITYTLKLNDDVQTPENIINCTLANTFTADGTTGEGPLTSEADNTTTFFLNNLNKGGYSAYIDGEKLIRWDISAGNYVDVIGGSTLTDILGSGMTFCTDIAPTYTIITPERSTGTLTWGTDIVIDPNDPSVATITLPGEGSHYEITYYTRFTEGEGNYTNTLEDGIHAPKSATANVSANGTSIHKEHTDDSNYVYYTVTAFIPKANYKTFFISDVLQVDGYANLLNYPENVVVTATDSTGTRELLPYGTGEGQSTTYGECYYLMMHGMNSYYSYKSEGSFYLMFNYSEYTNTGCPFTEDTTITMTYAIPKTSVVERTTKSISDALNMNSYVRNMVTMNINGQRDVTYSDYIYGASPLVKKGSVTDLGTGRVKYKVALTNTEIKGSDGNKGVMSSTLPEGFTNAYFLDNYDSRMDYVDGTLVAHVYPSPAYGGSIYSLTSEMSGWLYASFAYTGEPLGNPLRADFSDFTCSFYNRAYEGVDIFRGATLADVMEQHPEAFSVIFEYDLQLKPEYLDIAYAQEEMRITNTASYGYTIGGLTWSCDPVTATVRYTNNVIEKTAGELKSDDTVDFTIVVNSEGRDLTGLETIKVEDRMSQSLLLYMDTVKLYSGTPDSDEWTPLSGADITFDQTTNTLTMTVPDDVPVRITYTCKVLGSQDETVSISNVASISGYYNCVDSVSAEYSISGVSGGGSIGNSRVYVLKQDLDTHEPLIDAVFALYGPYNESKNGTAPEGVEQTISAHGDTLYYYRSFTSSANSNSALMGTFTMDDSILADAGHYAVVETAAPEGYVLDGTAHEFYMTARPANGDTDIPVLRNGQTLVVVNEQEITGYELPATGGIGVDIFYNLGTLLAVIATVLFVAEEEKRCKSR